ncbi:MAG: cobalamin B12-binding domain-containing protein [Firmicutes bacterium]|nr:cobalamin B12-binding domain-containing protein [Bacillota bacterium]
MKSNLNLVLAPLDPVHDVGLKVLRRRLEGGGHRTVLLPPDCTPEEVVQAAIDHQADAVLVSRTIGYGVAEVLSRLADVADAAGIRQKTKIIIGGPAVVPELAAELGFDAGFPAGADMEEVLAYLEGREHVVRVVHSERQLRDATAGHSYAWREPRIAALLARITDQALAWFEAHTSPGVERAALRDRMLDLAPAVPDGGGRDRGAGDHAGGGAGDCTIGDAGFDADLDPELRAIRKSYAELTGEPVRAFYEARRLPPGTRLLGREEMKVAEDKLGLMLRDQNALRLQHEPGDPVVFIQYGTGCPLMDMSHIKVAEAWGADGVLHFDPAWNVRAEGLLEGAIGHEESGTLYTPENLRAIRGAVHPATLWALRTHRGVNTPEIVLLAGRLGAHLVKINMFYGCLSGGTDPERMLVDGIEAIRLAGRFGLPYDIPVGQELSGVPAHKTLASILIVADIGLRLGARPILNPLFCYSPDVMVNGQMDRNYVDYNAARVWALQRVLDAPIKAGEPVGFMTHTEHRVQSAVATALHSALAVSLGVDSITVASVDEAYARGAITGSARVDSLLAVKEMFRFMGGAAITPTPRASEWADQLVDGIGGILEQVAGRGSLLEAVSAGDLGNKEEGVYPGRAGKGTVRRKV